MLYWAVKDGISLPKFDFIFIPGVNTTVFAVNPKCPREKILQLFNE